MHQHYRNLRRRYYLEARRVGYRSTEAWAAADVLARWWDAEDVEILAEPEQERYEDVYGKLEPFVDQHGRTVTREEQLEQLDRVGVWCVSSTVDGAVVDSVGMCAGYQNPTDWRENPYVIDLMAAALKQIDAEDAAARCGQ